MAYIQITNFTGSPSVIYDVVVTSVNPPYTSYTAGTIDSGTALPVVYGLPTAFDGDLDCYVQLQSQVDGSLSTVFNPQCGIVPPMSYKFESCNVDLTKNIYVFYDASGSYSTTQPYTNPNSILYACESVRTWYQNLVNNSGYTGNLYEAVVPGERWLSWMSIPAVGSMTGGTLPMGGGSVSLGNSTVPYSPTSPYYANTINGALNPADGVTPDSRSQGIPWGISNWQGGDNYGSFTPDNNYIAIVILNESESVYYSHYGPFVNGIITPTINTPIETDYNNWVKVWNNVNNTQSGFTRGFLYYVPTAGLSTEVIYAGLYQAIEISEGEIPNSSSEMDVRYGDSLGLWPNINTRLNSYSAYNANQYYDFSPLETVNRYTGLTAQTSYVALDPQYKNGPGLKNFGVKLNGTVTGLTTSQVETDLNSYILSVLQSVVLYTGTDPGYTIGESFKLTGYPGCWEYKGPRLDGQPQLSLSASDGPYADCSVCSATL